MASYLDRVNPNLVIVLHYVVKMAWIAAAVAFGIVGYNLYALGITQTGDIQLQASGIVLALRNAGPGLSVMCAALVCAVIGVIKSKVVLKEDKKGNREINVAAHPDTPPAQRECKLFSILIKYLAKAESMAFVMLNSRHEIDIQSLGWEAVPEGIRELAIQHASEYMKGIGDNYKAILSRSGGEWHVKCAGINAAQVLSGSGNKQWWCVVSVEPQGNEARAHSLQILRADTAALL